MLSYLMYKAPPQRPTEFETVTLIRLKRHGSSMRMVPPSITEDPNPFNRRFSVATMTLATGLATASEAGAANEQGATANVRGHGESVGLAATPTTNRHL